MKSILIIGLGRFGRHMARKFTEQGHSVLAIERNSETADSCIEIVKDIQIGDARSELFIDSLTSLEITVLLKDYGARYIVARATRDVYRNLLLRNGADYVVYAEREIAERLAIRFGSRNIYDYVRLGPDFEIFEISAPSAWIGHSILDKQVRRRHNVTILAVKDSRTGQISASPAPDYVFNRDDWLIVLGTASDVEKLR